MENSWRAMASECYKMEKRHYRLPLHGRVFDRLTDYLVLVTGSRSPTDRWRLGVCSSVLRAWRNYI